MSGLAGAAIRYPEFVPTDFLLVNERAKTFEEGVAALRWTDKLCTLLSVQTRRVRNDMFLKVALIQHVFSKVLPVPDPTSADCFWHTPVRYALQLDVLLLLKRILEHFVAAAFAIATTREFDAVKIVVSAAIVTLADVFLRKDATDIPSEVSLVWRKHNFGIKVSPFDEQSETIIVTMPELNIARTGVLDYWAALKIDPDFQVMNFNDTMAFDKQTEMFLVLICNEMGFPYNGQILPTMLTNETWHIIKNFPELEYFRDICFYFKYLLGTNPQAFPPIARYNQKQVELSWSFQQEQFRVRSFGGMPLTCAAKGHRWPSSAVASRFTAPHNVLTEDDILHLKELPDFDGKLGQRDSELLLSALTVPYLRIPIVVSFFATEDRIHALQSPVLQQLLDSVVFEPGRYLHKGKAKAPEFVPSKDETLLNTPYGLLINELARSPTQVMKATTQLLKLALALDTGSYFASQSDIILYVMRFGCRVENFVTFVLNYAAGKFDHLRIRDNEVSADVVEYLTEARREMRQILEVRYQRMLGLWCRECLARAQQLQEEAKHEQQREQAEEHRAGQDHGDLHGRARTAAAAAAAKPARSFKKVFNKEKSEAAKDFDALFQIVANLRAHVLLTMRNCYDDQWTADKLRHAVSIYTFLTARHTWNQNLLSFPEPELFEALQTIRRVILDTAARLKMAGLNKIMESVVAFVADADQLSIARGWGVFISKSTIGVPDIRQRGRYAVCESSARCALEDAQNPNRLHPRIDESRADTDMGVEINLQLMQLTLKSNHLEALNEPMSSDYDVTTVFGHRSLQVCG